MEAKDLRIGNYVEVLGNIDKIKGIGSNEHGEYAEFKNTYNGYYFIHNNEELVKPIPLTEEWLLKFGFQIEEIHAGLSEADFGNNPLTKDFILTVKNTGDGWFYRNGYFKIDYVHQLQNLYFALSGEELTLTEAPCEKKE
ncbi:hypothetical protein [Chryseobacterium taichungense]|uniref:hypothetical protein n=1 Tax=Chryseobacterium taichungense TaxID=295069 RepID=UPI0028AC1499|nr:hypothetical protein [Chryseobacterium taichungense]